MKRRILSIITALALCLSLCPTWALAAEADPSLCRHHPKHTEDCGYAAPTEGHDCGHEHTAACYTLGVLPDADGGDYYEIGADTENLLDCQHSHDSECGYVQADPGASCGYVCHICPIEDLIAALPEQVTEDNADDVRGQLDHILDLYRELNEDEQEEINLSRIYALQEALDAANVPNTIEGEVSVDYQEASWNDGVTYTTKTADSCTPVADSTDAVTWDAGWYVVNSTVTISEPITVTGAVNLILADGCTLDAQKGIVVTTDNSLTIYAQSGGTGTLTVTGTTDSDHNASAGIGGSIASVDSGTITIHGGVINATGGGQSGYYGAAGIGGGTSRSGNGGNSGTIIIYGNTVTANSGEGDLTGAGIGGGSGEVGGAGSNITIYGGSVTAASTGTGTGGAGIGGGGGFTGGGGDSNIQIHGGTVNATGGYLGAGIGGGADNAGTSGNGTVTISGGSVTAVGGDYAAGIGGGGYYYSSQYGSGGCTGGTGSVTISGGIVDASSPTEVAWEGYEGAPIGNGGNTTATATVEKTTGIVFENGAGTVYGDVTLDGSYTVPAAYTLNIPAGASLSGSGTLSGGGTFTTEILTADMISVPEDWHYTGEDLTEKIKDAVSLNGEITICGQTFTASTDGWELSVEKVSELEYTVKYTHTDKGTLSKTVTIARGQTALSDVVTYKEDGTTPANTFSVGETIIVKATATFPANNAIMAAAEFDTPAGEQMAVYHNDTQISAPSTVENGVHTMTVDTSNLPESALNKEIVLTVKYIESGNASGAETEVKVTVTAVAKVAKGSSTTFVGALADAFTEGNSGATVTLLSEVDLGSNYIGIRGSSTFTLDLNGQTVKASHYGAFDISGGSLTIQDSGTGGKIESSNITIEVTGGTLSIQSGAVSGLHGVQISSGTVNISGGTISGSDTGLWVSGGGNITLSGGTFSGVVAVQVDTNASVTLKDLLASECAYHQNDIPVANAAGPGGEVPLDAKPAWLPGTVTVKECSHTGGLVPSENGYQHGGPCKCCNTALTAENHTLGADNQCSGCGAALAAKVEKSGSDTIYVEASGLEAAFAKNSGNDGATFTLLANVEPNTYLTIQINCILNLGGHTITGHIGSNQCVCVDENTAVTILGEGEIIAPNGIALAVDGSVTLEGGTYTSTGSEDFSHGVNVDENATLSVTGEKVTIRNTGGGSGLNVSFAQSSVQLSAGTYSGAKAIESIVKLSDMLAHTDNTRYAYYQNDIPVTKASAWVDNNIGDVPLDTPIAWLSDTVTVKACNHAGEGVCTYTHNENTSTHTKTCLACGKTWDAEDCAYTFSGGTGTCAACGDSVTVTVSGTDGLIYDGTEKEPGVTVMRGETALTAGTDYTVAYTDNKNAGENKATVTVTIGNGQGNYIQNFTIGRAALTIKANDQTITYGVSIAAGTDQVTPAGLCTGDTLEGVTLSASSVNVPGGTITPSGAVIKRSGKDVTANYNINYMPGTLTINPVDVKLTFNDQTITYGDTPTGATADPASAKIEYSYTTGEGGEPISGWPTNAGTYTVTAKVEATGNYGEASETATLTINPKAVSKPTIELSPNTFVYDGTGKEPAVTVKDGEKVIPADEYTVGYSNNINAGTATVTITNVAGNYTVSGTTTFAITAKPLTGAKVEVTGTFTYTGSAQEPTPTVTLGGKTLTENTDYTVAYASNTNAGTAKITVTGMGNYSGTAQGTFTIGRADLTADGTGIASGTYGDKLSGLTVSGLTAKLGEATVTGTWKLTGDTVPNVGDSGEYTATFTPATGADNYNALTAQVTLSIAKANYTGTTTANTSAKFGSTGTYDLSALLPDGVTAETAATTSNIFEGTPSVSDKTLTYTLKADAAVDSTGTITVPVTSTNYNNFNLTITVTVTAKDVPTLTVSPITVTYTGEAVPGTAIKGTAKVGSTTVPGTWAFASGEAVTNVADSGTKTVKFGPTDGTNYAEATATVVVTINKATPTGAPKYTAISTSGKTLADAGLTTEGSTLKPAGTVAWVLGTDTAVTANTQYEWTFTPTDTANYNTLTGKITLWPYTAPVNPGGGYVPSNPGGTSLPVTTTGQGSSTTTTTTTATPTASTQGGTATTAINTAMGNEIVKQATANKSEEVVIAPNVTGSVTKAEVSIPASTVGQIGSQTNASLTVSTPVADVTIPNGGLGSLSSAGGTVTVTAEQVGNSVELSVTAGGRTVQNVPGGVTLTVPAANTTPGTVAVLVHEDGTREVVRKSVADNGTVTIPLDGSAKLEIVDNSKYFADVPATSWAADAVAFASSHELFNGTAPGQFSPDTPMSRGMLAVVLHNLESNPAQALTGAFTDVDNSQWYAEGVAWAEAQGIIGGYGNGQFGPNDNITREQLAVMLWRYAGSPAATDRELHFADAHRASDWALEALRWATEKGIINGKGGGILDPTGQATRAETAQMLKNYMENQ